MYPKIRVAGFSPWRGERSLYYGEFFLTLFFSTRSGFVVEEGLEFIALAVSLSLSFSFLGDLSTGDSLFFAGGGREMWY